MTGSTGSLLKHTSTSEVPKRAVLPSQIGTDLTFKKKIVWFNAMNFIILHVILVYDLFLALTGRVYFKTIIWAIIIGWLSGEGLTIGAHRLWTHRSFKAKFPLRIVLLILQTIAGQNSLWIWVRDHRQHHKYSDTDADPHNPKQGFFFSHIGWLMIKKHPLVFEYGKDIDMSDLNADAWVMFQKRYYKILYAIFTIGMPAIVPIYMWGEDPFISFLTSIARLMVVTNFTLCINSFAHRYGNRPYDSKLQPTESLLASIVTSGEGWHNYHHAFPWDYRTAEMGRDWNCTTHIIDWLAKIGQVYDRKAAPDNMVTARIKRCGDGTHPMGNKESSEKITAGPTDVIDASGYPLTPSDWNAGKAPKMDPKFENYTADTKHMVIEPDLGN